MVDAARRFGAGDLTARAPVPKGLGELSDVALAINAAADDIERRQRDHARLLAELVAAEEETRRRIAADIHDDTAQAVAAVGLRMDALVSELTRPGGARDRGEGSAARSARPTGGCGGCSSSCARPLSTGPASRRRSSCSWRTPSPTTASTGVSRTASRASRRPRSGRSSTASLSRHSRTCASTPNASLVEVRLERRGAGVAVRVRDDGTGFELPAPDAPPDPGHIGMVSMRERAEAAGGRLGLTSTPGGGTTVDFWMPESNGAGRARPSPGSRAASPRPPRRRGPRRRASRRRAGDAS